MTMQHQLEAYVAHNRKRFEDLLGQMVNIPSISMDPAKANDMRRMATLARQDIERSRRRSADRGDWRLSHCVRWLDDWCLLSYGHNL